MNEFNTWNQKKQITHAQENIPYFFPGEIWWAQIGKNIGSESIGKGADFLRPVLVLQKFYGKSALVIPLTKRNKTGSYYFRFKNIKNESHTALLPQIRYLDGRRLNHKLSEVSPETFATIQNKFFGVITKYPQPQRGGGSLPK